MGITPNFNRSEFACKCGCGLDLIDPIFVQRLQRMRDIAGVPITVTSGCRCEDHNRSVGGKDDSPHLPGPDGECRAADIVIQGRDVLEMFVFAEDLDAFRGGGIGLYLPEGFIHVDAWKFRRWSRFAGKYGEIWRVVA